MRPVEHHLGVLCQRARDHGLLRVAPGSPRLIGLCGLLLGADVPFDPEIDPHTSGIGILYGDAAEVHARIKCSVMLPVWFRGERLVQDPGEGQPGLACFYPEITTRLEVSYGSGTAFLHRGESVARTIAILGVSGSGKTALLSSLLLGNELLGPYGKAPRLSDRARLSSRPCALELVVRMPAREGSTVERARFASVDGREERHVPAHVGAISSRYLPDEAGFKVDFFPADRFLPDPPPGRAKARSRAGEGADRVSVRPEKYHALWSWFVERLEREAAERDAALSASGFAFADESSSVLRRLQQRLNAFRVPVALRGLRDSRVPFFRDDRGRELELGELPGSARHAFLFALAFEMVPHARSWVLVDELPRGVSSDREAAWLHGVRAGIGQSQLFFSTSSAQLAQLADVVVRVEPC